MTIVQDTLRSLGITRKYRGFRYTEISIELVLEDEDRLQAVTKEVYYEAARRCGCKWSAVERGIRTAVQRAWRVNRGRLVEMAGYPLEEPPIASEFIEIVSNHIQRSSMPQP